MATFEEQVAEALSAPFTGWGFSWLAARASAGSLLWNYPAEVARRVPSAPPPGVPESWPVTVRQRRFLLVASKPGEPVAGR